MPPKRTRRAEPNVHGLAAGERLKRAKLAGSEYLAWSWVGTEVTDHSQITQEHRLATCGFSDSNPYPFCANKYSTLSRSRAPSKTQKGKKSKPAQGELEDDIIVISDDESPACNTKTCRTNPNCLNYLGQEKWENEEKARNAFMQAAQLGFDPTVNSRADGTPVGLKNLGATCYANAFLQVWFQDLRFRTGVYSCQPSSTEEQKFEESPIFQLQVTFAAMQLSKESAFNPSKLVESLKLRTTEQQDAQEFSKLFMAHLDTEFQKQADPTLKSLVADQFQGKQVYATVCTKCHHRSERESEFLEIEVNLANNARLEERLAALLQPEDLNGDNKYLCSKCESLQNAKRYTEFRELPPVLHFSLLRFVYDLSTMERKKSKQAIAFPLSLHMSRFVAGSNATANEEYQLRGILLHKGASAYHGHYEAQIFDVKDRTWYQFNDEVVTKINSLGPHPRSGTKGEEKGAKLNKVQPKLKKSVPSKKATKAESDVEVVDDSNSSKSKSPAVEDKNYILSRDAYMLVYVRSPSGHIVKSETMNGGDGDDVSAISEPIDPVPPPRAAEVIHKLNIEHDKACADYEAKETEADLRFNTIKRKVVDIYQSWELSSNTEENRVVSRQALEAWLSRHLVQRKDKASDSEDADTDAPVHELSNADIACSHGQLDPTKASHMKRIKKTAADRILSEDGCQFTPSLGSSDVCEECVRGLFLEKLYQAEHPRLVSLFDDVCPVDEGDFAYWISKSWLKDWRQAKPRMHKASREDPPPNGVEYEAHVICEHGQLTPNILSRRRISAQAYELLKSIFPAWSTLTTEAEICATCEALAHISKEDRREAKIQAEEEKAKLKHMFDNALNGGTGLLDNVPCAVVPAHFVRSWKQWLFHPSQELRPDAIDNSQFICQHDLLVLDPNSPGDLDSTVVIITRSDWDTLETLYPCGPLIAVENTGSRWTHELAVCKECRLKKKSSYESTEITIRVLRAEDPIPTGDSPTTRSPPKERSSQGKGRIQTYSSRLRQSKRIRQRDPCKRRKVTITRDMTLKELKIKVQEELGIPTIYQHLYHHGRELDENSATISSLNVLANDVVDLREDSEDIDLLGSGSEQEAGRGDGGEGFGGTLLASSNHPSSSSPTQSDHDEAPDGMVKACPTCTFENPPDVLSCTMCDSPFNS